MVGILGSRQCGKTTLAHDYIAARSEPRVHYFDAERVRVAGLGRLAREAAGDAGDPGPAPVRSDG